MCLKFIPRLNYEYFLFDCAGQRKSGLRTNILGYRSEQQSNASMDLEKAFPELNKKLYPHIEPYSTGLLKVSDLHTIYWEQSGNPNGHVSMNYSAPFIISFSVTIC